MTLGTIRVEVGYTCNDCGRDVVEENTVWTERHRYTAGNAEGTCRDCGSSDIERTVRFVGIKRTGDHVGECETEGFGA